MINMKTTLLYIGMLAASTIVLGSCSDDFLSQSNSHHHAGKLLRPDAAVEKAVWPLYSYVWYDFNDKFYYGMGDGRANNITAQYSNYIYPYTNFTETSLSQGTHRGLGIALQRGGAEQQCHQQHPQLFHRRRVRGCQAVRHC